MEKQGVVKPGKTPDTENKVPEGEKQGSTEARTRQLDDDLTHRLADKAADGLKSGS